LKNTGYDNVAAFYDEVLGSSNEKIKFVSEKIAEYNSSAISVFELGCGTGSNLLFLSGDYKISGVDINENMLNIARNKIGGSRLFIGDIREVILKEKTDVVFCVYDTINHLLLFNDWKKVFRNAFNSLNDNGLFIFDFNTLYKLFLISGISPVVNNFGNSYLIADVKKISLNVFNWNLKVFEHIESDDFRLHETNIKEASFEINKIFKALRKYFRILETADEYGNRVNKRSERVFVICRKLNKKI